MRLKKIYLCRGQQQQLHHNILYYYNTAFTALGFSFPVDRPRGHYTTPEPGSRQQ